MPKIKDIHNRLLKDPKEYSAIVLLVAERIFLTTTTLYFLSMLGTIGGFYLSWLSQETLSMLTYNLYSLLIVSVIFFGFSWTEHMVFIYAPEKRWISYIALVILLLIGLLALYVHISSIL